MSLFLFSCGSDDSSRSSGIAAGATADNAASIQEAQQLQQDREQAISSILSAYYQDLEAESISVQEYYAPVVSSFFSQKNLSRSEISNIINNGFKAVENRSILLDKNSLIVTELIEGFEAVFEGELSFTNSKDGSEVQELFKNRVVFNEDLQIISYTSLDSKREVSAKQNSLAPEASMADSIKPLIEALKKNDYSSLQKYIHPELGYYYITRPGAFDAIHYFSQASAMERQANTPWISDIFSEIDCQPVKGTSPDFNCEGFSKEGCFLAEVTSYERVSKLMKALAEYDYGEFSQTEMDAAANLEASITHELISTKSYLSLSLGLIDGQWYILVVDPAVYDCSA